MKVAIIGCGVAGVTAARTLREEAQNVDVEVYTDENHLYYPRPRLYEVLSGEKQPIEIYSYSQEWYQNNKINVNLDKKVLSIDTDGKKLSLNDSSTVGYDQLLLANGASPFVPPIKGVDKSGVFTLRTIEHALAIRRFAKSTERAIVIGGGLLGLEFAACLRKLRQQVVVIEVNPRLLPLQLDQQAASMLKRDLEELGIEAVLGVKIDEIMGKDTVEGVSLDNGKQVSGGLALIAAGVRSNTQLAEAAGIRVNKGVVINQYLQTSADDVYAAGDVCEFQGQVYGIIPPAIDQARIATSNMLGKEKRIYNGSTHSTTLKIAGITMTSIGLVNPEGSGYEEVRKVDEREAVYKKIVVNNGVIVGAILLGDRRNSSALMKLINEKADVSKYKDSLLDDDFDYRQIWSK